jgi:hypothetical protein
VANGRMRWVRVRSLCLQIERNPAAWCCGIFFGLTINKKI